jgi:hypothetical protein
MRVGVIAPDLRAGPPNGNDPLAHTGVREIKRAREIFGVFGGAAVPRP